MLEKAYIDGEPCETERGWHACICIPGIDGNFADVYGEDSNDALDNAKRIVEVLTSHPVFIERQRVYKLKDK